MFLDNFATWQTFQAQKQANPEFCGYQTTQKRFLSLIAHSCLKQIKSTKGSQGQEFHIASLGAHCVSQQQSTETESSKTLEKKRFYKKGNLTVSLLGWSTVIKIRT